jgi:hypothetical protein
MALFGQKVLTEAEFQRDGGFGAPHVAHRHSDLPIRNQRMDGRFQACLSCDCFNSECDFRRSAGWQNMTMSEPGEATWIMHTAPVRRRAEPADFLTLSNSHFFSCISRRLASIESSHCSAFPRDRIDTLENRNTIAIQCPS